MAHTFMIERSESLTNTLFSLEEPWRSRFLDLIAKQATDRAGDGPAPTPEEVTTWLGDIGLHQRVTRLLHVWQRK